MTTVLTFGTFDTLHHGHDVLLSRAKELGDRLVVGIARDVHVLALKGHAPVQDQNERLASVRRHPAVSDAILCDETLRGYDILNRVKPDVIALGFDQKELKDDLQRWMGETNRRIRIETVEAYD